MEHREHTPHDPMVIQLNRHAPTGMSAHTSTPGMNRGPKKPFYKRRSSVWILGVVAVIGLGLLIYSIAGRGDTVLSNTFDSGVVGSVRGPVDIKDTAGVIARVGRLIRLPEDEQPTVAMVSNLDPLKNQAFFTHARIGDVVLMYAKARKAILYSPQEDRIIEVAPIVTGEQR